MSHLCKPMHFSQNVRDPMGNTVHCPKRYRVEKDIIRLTISCQGSQEPIVLREDKLNYYTMSKTRPPFYFLNTCQKLTNFNNFCNVQS